MEILRFLLSFFENEYQNGKYKPIIELLKNNNFDFGSLLKNFNMSDFAPIIEAFVEKNEKKPSEDFSSDDNGLLPISSFADSDVIYSLNKFFASY